MPHACSAPTARWVKCGATVMVAWATIPSMVAVNTEVPSERAVTTPGPLMETTDGADELKVIEGFVIRRPLASRAVTGTMSCSSTSSVVSRMESVASAGGSVPFLHAGSVALPRRTIQKTEWCTLIAILGLVPVLHRARGRLTNRVQAAGHSSTGARSADDSSRPAGFNLDECGPDDGAFRLSGPTTVAGVAPVPGPRRMRQYCPLP